MDIAERYKKSEDMLAKRIKKLKNEKEKGRGNKDREVNAEDIRVVVSNWTGIPLNTLGSKEKSALLKLDSKINKQIIGQKEAVEGVSAIKRARTGILM